MCEIGSALLTNTDIEGKNGVIPKGTILFDPTIASHSMIADRYLESSQLEDKCTKIEVDWNLCGWHVDGDSKTCLKQSEINTIDKWFKENFGSYDLVLGVILERLKVLNRISEDNNLWSIRRCVGCGPKVNLTSEEQDQIILAKILNRRFNDNWKKFWRENASN